MSLTFQHTGSSWIFIKGRKTSVTTNYYEFDDVNERNEFLGKMWKEKGYEFCRSFEYRNSGRGNDNLIYCVNVHTPIEKE
jgi:hypothetical protein